MKKIILLAILAFFAVVNLNAQSDLCVISGEWNRWNAKEVSLYCIVSGRLEKVSTYYMKDDHTFTFAFVSASENYYVIGTESPSTKMSKYTFYLKPGDHLNIAVDDTTYALIGENTKENIAMTAWHDYIWPLEYYAIYRTPKASRWTYVDYFPVLEEKFEQPYVAERTGNSAFDASFEKFRKFDLISDAGTFLLTPRSAHPQDEDYPDYYKTIKFSELSTNTDVLTYPYDILKLASYMEGKFGGPKINGPRAMIDSAKDETLKAELFLEYLSSVSDFSAMEDLKAQYSKYIKTDDQKRRMEEQTARITKKLMEQGVGKPAIDFTYKDVTGKSVSLSDFKGKVVYVDVWATWCGPCRKELPHLKAVEEKYHGNDNIVFIGVSSDDAKDIQKWKNFVEKEQLPGVQLHGGIGGDQDIRKLYQINGIPRFLLFDKKGNIVSVNAPRPSSEELVPLLTELLK